MVEGASHFLFCHDDVAPDPDAVHLLMEEAFRSNAGIVAPKLVELGRPGPAAARRHGRRQERCGRRPGRARRARRRPARRRARRVPGAGRLHLGARRPVRRARRLRPRTSSSSARTSTCAGGPRWPALGSWSPRRPGCAISSSWPAGAGRCRTTSSRRSGRAAAAPLTRPLHAWARSAATGTAGDASAAPAAATCPGRRRRAPAPGPPAPGGGAWPGVTLQSLQRRHELHAVMKSYGRFHLARRPAASAVLCRRPSTSSPR